MLKDYEKVAGKLEKTSKSKKADQLQAELDQITASLASLSPMVYTTYQRLDEQRLASLKEIIVRWGTVRGDMATRDGERAGSTIASLLEWEPTDELLETGRKLGGGRSGSVAPSTAPSVGSIRRPSDAEFRPQPRTNGSSQNTPTFGGIKSMLGRSKTQSTRKRSDSASITSREPEFESLPEEQPPIDNEGFSVPPPDRHRTLWDEPEDAVTTPKLDLGLKAAPIEETEESKSAAMKKVQQSLQMPSAPSRRSTIGRGRRDVRNTVFSPALDLTPPVPGSTSVARAVIAEAINVILRGGAVQRLQINGEIHVESPPSGPVHIRIDRFERLEKIAPNPQYLTQVPDTPGEYELDTDSLASRNALLFKYQVHTDNDTALPLMLEPAFLVKNGETRMILNYNAARSLAVTITASFQPGPAVANVQAKPAGGAWSSATRTITWDLGEISGPGKIIAKFTTDGELQPGNISASWKTDGLLSDINVNLDEVQKKTTTGKYLAEPVFN